MIKKLLLASVLFTLSTSGAFAFQEEYFVSGVNLTTGERVIGWLDGTLNEAEVQGHIRQCLVHGDGGRAITAYSASVLQGIIQGQADGLSQSLDPPEALLCLRHQVHIGRAGQAGEHMIKKTRS